LGYPAWACPESLSVKPSPTGAAPGRHRKRFALQAAAGRTSPLPLSRRGTCSTTIGRRWSENPTRPAACEKGGLDPDQLNGQLADVDVDRRTRWTAMWSARAPVAGVVGWRPSPWRRLRPGRC